MPEEVDSNAKFDQRINLELLKMQLLAILINFTLVQEVFDSFGISPDVFNFFSEIYGVLLYQLSNPDVVISELPTLDTSFLPASYLDLLEGQILDGYHVAPDWEGAAPEAQFYLLEYCIMRLYLISGFDHGTNPISQAAGSVANVLRKPGEDDLNSQLLITCIMAAINELTRPIQLEVANATLAKMLYQRQHEINSIFGQDLEYANPLLLEQFQIIKDQGRVVLTIREVDELRLQLLKFGLQPLQFYVEEVIQHPSNQFVSKSVMTDGNQDTVLYFKTYKLELIQELIEFIRDFQCY